MTHSFGTPIYATAEEEQQARDSGELYGERYEQNDEIIKRRQCGLIVLVGTDRIRFVY